MKRVILDHCVPRPFRDLLADCSASTAHELGWSGLKNGELLSAAEAAGFEILITADRNLRYQQNLADRQIAIIELPTNRLRLVVAYAEHVNSLLSTAHPGSYHTLNLE
jgi:hypothetical protein